MDLTIQGPGATHHTPYSGVVPVASHWRLAKELHPLPSCTRETTVIDDKHLPILALRSAAANLHDRMRHPKKTYL